MMDLKALLKVQMGLLHPLVDRPHARCKEEMDCCMVDIAP
jgi:hypothetical protein